MSEHEIWKRDEVESPCVKLCSIHPSAQVCIGCLRNLREIGAWSLMSAEERRAVIEILPTRRDLVAKRRGGRRSRVSGKD